MILDDSLIIINQLKSLGFLMRRLETTHTLKRLEMFQTDGKIFSLKLMEYRPGWILEIHSEEFLLSFPYIDKRIRCKRSFISMDKPISYGDILYTSEKFESLNLESILKHIFYVFKDEIRDIKLKELGIYD